MPQNSKINSFLFETSILSDPITNQNNSLARCLKAGLDPKSQMSYVLVQRTNIILVYTLTNHRQSQHFFKKRREIEKGSSVAPIAPPTRSRSRLLSSLIRSRATHRCGCGSPIRSPDPPASAPIRASFHRSSSFYRRRALAARWSGDPSLQPGLLDSFLLPLPVRDFVLHTLLL